MATHGTKEVCRQSTHVLCFSFPVRTPGTNGHSLLLLLEKHTLLLRTSGRWTPPHRHGPPVFLHSLGTGMGKTTGLWSFPKGGGLGLCAGTSKCFKRPQVCSQVFCSQMKHECIFSAFLSTRDRCLLPTLAPFASTRGEAQL